MTCAVLLCAFVAVAAAPRTRDVSSAHAAGFESITQAELLEHCVALCDPKLEGRDSPSVGLREAARYIAERFRLSKLAYAPDSSAAWKQIVGSDPVGAPASPTGDAPTTERAGTYLRPFTRTLPEPDPAGCALELVTPERTVWKLGPDFVPFPFAAGKVEGEFVFAGFAIKSKDEGYSDVEGLNLRGKIAVVLEGEPRHPKRFEGPELSRAASLFEKLELLGELGAVGAIVVGREPTAGALPKGVRPQANLFAGLPLSFRHTWADWVGERGETLPKKAPPALYVSMATASALVGTDLEAIAAKLDKLGARPRVDTKGRSVSLAAKTRQGDLVQENVVGIVRGTDPVLAEEFVVVGAHYDHIGVDARGRIGFGADDNASGTSALLEIAQALAAAPPRRSVCLVAFAGEEDGLLGSKALTRALPFAKEKIVAMINLDMIGRGEADQVAVIGIVQNPTLESVLTRAQKLKQSGVKKLTLREGEELFQRSDHYPFHELGVPVLFFFEGLPISKNKDYHTWRDTLDKLDFQKIHNTTRLVYGATWLLANDDERPPKPRD